MLNLTSTRGPSSVTLSTLPDSLHPTSRGILGVLRQESRADTVAGEDFRDSVGKVDSVTLDGPRVLVKFNMDEHLRLGDRTEAAIKTKSLLGSKIMEITPRGDGPASGTIPVDRLHVAYQLPDALGDLTATISGLNHE